MITDVSEDAMLIEDCDACAAEIVSTYLAAHRRANEEPKTCPLPNPPPLAQGRGPIEADLKSLWSERIIAALIPSPAGRVREGGVRTLRFE